MKRIVIKSEERINEPNKSHLRVQLISSSACTCEAKALTVSDREPIATTSRMIKMKTQAKNSPIDLQNVKRKNRGKVSFSKFKGMKTQPIVIFVNKKTQLLIRSAEITVTKSSEVIQKCTANESQILNRGGKIEQLDATQNQLNGNDGSSMLTFSLIDTSKSKKKCNNKKLKQALERECGTYSTAENEEREGVNTSKAQIKKNNLLLDLSNFPKPLMRADDVLRQVRAEKAEAERKRTEHVMPLVIGGDYVDLLPIIDESDPLLSGEKIDDNKSEISSESQINYESKGPHRIRKRKSLDDDKSEISSESQINYESKGSHRIRKRKSLDDRIDNIEGLSEQPKATKVLHNTGHWSKDEHKLFLQALKKYGASWGPIASTIQSRTRAQIRSHAQKYFQRLSQSGNLQQKKKHDNSLNISPRVRNKKARVKGKSLEPAMPLVKNLPCVRSKKARVKGKSLETAMPLVKFSSIDESDPLQFWEKKQIKLINPSNSANTMQVRKKFKGEIEHGKKRIRGTLTQEGSKIIDVANSKSLHPIEILPVNAKFFRQEKIQKSKSSIAKNETSQQSSVTAVSQNAMIFVNADSSLKKRKNITNIKPKPIIVSEDEGKDTKADKSKYQKFQLDLGEAYSKFLVTKDKLVLSGINANDRRNPGIMMPDVTDDIQLCAASITKTPQKEQKSVVCEVNYVETLRKLEEAYLDAVSLAEEGAKSKLTVGTNISVSIK